MYSLLLETPMEDMPLVRALEPDICNAIVKTHNIPEGLPWLNFQVDAHSMGGDWSRIQNTLGGKLCSSQFLEVVSQAAASFLACPAHLVDTTTGERLSSTSSFWVPAEVENVIDWEHSEIWTDPVTGTRSLTKLIVSSEIEQAALPLFKQKGSGRIFVHEKLRVQLQAVGITGISFAPLDTIYMPQQGRRKPELEQWIQDHPEDMKGWFALSDLLDICHRYHEALHVVDQFLARKPDEAKGWQRRGRLLEKLGHLQEALEAYQQAVQLDPHSIAWAGYGQTLRALGYKHEALQVARQFVQERGEIFLSWQELGNAYAALEDDPEALTAFAKALSIGGRFFGGVENLYRTQGKVLYRLKQYETALAAYDAAEPRQNNDKGFWKEKAGVLYALGREVEARLAEQKATQLEQRWEENLGKRPM